MSMLLGGWAATCSILCIVHAIWWSKLGWGGLEYLIFFAPVVLAFLAFATAWSILGDDFLLMRLLVVPLVMGGLAVQFVFSMDAPGLLLELLKMFVAVALPALLLWRRGVRITRRPGGVRGGSWLSFSIADLLIATTGLAVLLGLAMVERPVASDLLFVLLFALPVFIVVPLAFSAKWAYVVLLVLCVPCAVLVVEAFVDANAAPFSLVRVLGAEVGLMLLMGCIQVLNQTLVAGAMRWLGYRLRYVG